MIKQAEITSFSQINIFSSLKTFDPGISHYRTLARLCDFCLNSSEVVEGLIITGFWFWGDTKLGVYTMQVVFFSLLH